MPLIEHLPEFKALEDEDGRRVAFAKYVKRQKVFNEMHSVALDFF